jgi:hypothetical protein
VVQSVLSIARLDSGSNSRETMPGYEMAYTEFTSDVVITATTGATANTIVTASAVAFDGLTTVMVEFFSFEVYIPTASGYIAFILYDGSTQLGNLGFWGAPGGGFGNDTRIPVRLARRLTPTAASHTYSVRAFQSGGSSPSVDGGAGASGQGMPGFIRITRV